MIQLLHFLMEGIHIWHNDCLWYADFNEGSDHLYVFGIKGRQGQMYVKSLE